MRALLLLLELNGPLEHYAEPVKRLLMKLPGSGKVFYRHRTLGIAVLPAQLPEILLARVRLLLDAEFEDWAFMELGEYSMSKNGPNSAFESWMDDNVRPSNWRQMRKSKDVIEPKWRKTRNQ